MNWEGKPWHGLSYELKDIFGQKIIKLSLDGGFTCPNRDGTLGTGGCSFCGEEGSGAHAGDSEQSIAFQIRQQRKRLENKWPGAPAIAYFQNFTGTYGEPERLEQMYREALQEPGIVGIAIATRPDCLGPGVMEILKKMNSRTFLWIELGLQTIHDASAKHFGRGYPYDCFLQAYEELQSGGIRTVVHLINGLPGETEEMMRESARKISNLKPWGIKLHLLHIIKGTKMAEEWQGGEYIPMTFEAYINMVADQLELLAPDITIHRLTGDGAADALLAPLWSRDKKRVLGSIEMELKKRESWQGKHCHLRG